jgi:hypothetical protein
MTYSLGIVLILGFIHNSVQAGVLEFSLQGSLQSLSSENLCHQDFDSCEKVSALLEKTKNANILERHEMDKEFVQL